MIKITKAIFVLLPLLATPLLSATEQEAKEKVAKLLRESAEQFLAVIEDVDEEQWNFKGSGLRHSIGEEAEHVAFAEQELQQVILKALQDKAEPEKAKKLAGKEELVREKMLDPDKTAESYKRREKLNSKLEVLEYFGAAHKKLIQQLQGSRNLEVQIYRHPVAEYGDLTALQWFYYIAYHKLRHCKQIEIIKSHADYPSRVRKTSREPLPWAAPAPVAAE